MNESPSGQPSEAHVRLECLRLASLHAEPCEVLRVAERYARYVLRGETGAAPADSATPAAKT